jgi:polyhydroxyalkanoate synthesis regulator protein
MKPELKVWKIKKYINRKLYDSEEGRYITMLELSDLVAHGARVEVTCDRSGRDITIEALSRALYERLKERDVDKGAPFLPKILAGLIKQVSRRRPIA